MVALIVGSNLDYQQFRRWPEQAGLELIDGWAVKEPSPGSAHQACVARLFSKIDQFVWARRIGFLFPAPLDVILGQTHVVQPDVLFVSSARVEVIQDHGIVGAPDLAIEVLSPSTRHYDQGPKKALYLEYGCRELWLIDLEFQGVELCRARDGGQAWASHLLDQSGTLRSSVLKGFSLELSQVLAENPFHTRS